MGAYHFIADKLRTRLGIAELPYIGRDTNASPAVGSKQRHKAEQEGIITQAVGPMAEAAASAPNSSKKAAARATV